MSRRRTLRRVSGGTSVSPGVTKTQLGQGAPRLWLCPELPSLHRAFQGSVSKWVTRYLTLWELRECTGCAQHRAEPLHISKPGAGVQASLLLRDGSPQDGWSITEKITTSMLKAQKNLHSSMEKTSRLSERLQHPWDARAGIY